MEQYLAQAQQLLADYGIKVIAAIAIFIIGKWIAKLLTKTIRKVMGKSKLEPMLITFSSNLTYAALMVFVVLAALNQLGIQTTSFIAVIGAAGLAIGLAMQDSLSNFAAGVMLIVFRPFKTGDFVEAAGTAGTVLEIQIFTTRLKTGDNRLIHIPNGKIISGNIVNFSANETRRIDMVFGISYDDNIKKAKSIIEETLQSDSRVLTDPKPTIGVLELGDSSVNIAVRPWVNTADYWPTLFDLNETIKEKFDGAGITIPYPQSDVHLFRQESPSDTAY
jgi:small conductance mechanosensitive channel